MAYAGHQFGHFTLLGDGRAHLLGEHVAPDGSRWDLHYKGSGPTPFSRRGDGRAALGPMLREYLISEAMHALGIPSTRSLSVVETGATVQRETPLKGAVLLRVAASHLRVGTFNGRQLNPSSSGSANSWITRFKGTILNARRTPILQEAFWSISCKDRSISSSIGCG